MNNQGTGTPTVNNSLGNNAPADLPPNDELDDDQLDREQEAIELADKLQSATIRTLMIRGPWGSGKSWFARQVKKQLDKKPDEHKTKDSVRDKANEKQLAENQDKHKTIWINAFSHEWLGDPLLLLWHEVLSHANPDDQQKWIKQLSSIIATVGATMLAESSPLLKKLMNVAQGVKGEHEAERSITAEKSGQLQQLGEEKNELEKLLKKIMGEKKLFIFIDELDRCNHHFAVRLFERVKHYFNLDNVVVIYVAEEDILLDGIAGYYNVDIKSLKEKDYLEKFIDITYDMNKFVMMGNMRKNNPDYYLPYINHLLGLPRNDRAALSFTIARSLLYLPQNLRMIKKLVKNIRFNGSLDIKSLNNNDARYDKVMQRVAIILYMAKHSNDTKEAYKIFKQACDNNPDKSFGLVFKMAETMRISPKEEDKPLRHLFSQIWSVIQSSLSSPYDEEQHAYMYAIFRLDDPNTPEAKEGQSRLKEYIDISNDIKYMRAFPMHHQENFSKILEKVEKASENIVLEQPQT